MAPLTPALSWWPAPAKLNLFLHIIARRSDGYHELQTLFQLIDLNDRIGLAARADGRIERVTGLADVAPECDLAVRAAQALQRHSGASLGAELHVIKHIPRGRRLGRGQFGCRNGAAGLESALGHGPDAR